MPPPAKVLAEAEVREMVPVPVTVRLVKVPVPHPLVPANVHVPDPIAMVLMFVLLLLTPELPLLNVTLKVAASNVPLVIVKAFAPELLDTNASCNVTEPPGESIINCCINVLPALVIV